MTPEITCEALRDWLADETKPRPVLLDVRGADEHELAHLEGSVLVPLHELEARVDELMELRSRPVVAYCHHGMRSLYATDFLRQRGFDVHSLAGGLDAWAVTIDPTVPRY